MKFTFLKNHTYLSIALGLILLSLLVLAPLLTDADTRERKKKGCSGGKTSNPAFTDADCDGAIVCSPRSKCLIGSGTLDPDDTDSSIGPVSSPPSGSNGGVTPPQKK